MRAAPAERPPSAQQGTTTAETPIKGLGEGQWSAVTGRSLYGRRRWRDTTGETETETTGDGRRTVSGRRQCSVVTPHRTSHALARTYTYAHSETHHPGLSRSTAGYACGCVRLSTVQKRKHSGGDRSESVSICVKAAAHCQQQAARKDGAEPALIPRQEADRLHCIVSRQSALIHGSRPLCRADGVLTADLTAV